jgi:hypothetical protein
VRVALSMWPELNVERTAIQAAAWRVARSPVTLTAVSGSPQTVPPPLWGAAQLSAPGSYRSVQGSEYLESGVNQIARDLRDPVSTAVTSCT